MDANLVHLKVDVDQVNTEQLLVDGNLFNHSILNNLIRYIKNY